jgi:hypothetical protein
MERDERDGGSRVGVVGILPRLNLTLDSAHESVGMERFLSTTCLSERESVKWNEMNAMVVVE